MRYLYFILLLLMLTSCNKLKSGKIVGKDIHPPYTSLMYAGKTLVPIYHPRSYTIYLCGKYENKTRCEEWTVSLDYYNAVSIGDSIVTQNP